MERITIIGTSPIGISMGLALKRAKLSNTEVIGSSGDRSALSKASKMGAYDKDISSLGQAVEGAQMIILDVPFVEVYDILHAISPIIEDGCVITDIMPTKVKTLEWAENLLPKSVDFVGGHPLLKQKVGSIDDASASLFDKVDYCLIPSVSTDQSSVKTVVGLVELLGANPFFLDPHEHDSYSMAMDVLPTVLSSAFVTTASRSESWREMHKLAASTFDSYSQLATSDPIHNEAACLANADTLIHWIDQYISELYSYRNMIKENSDSLLDTFIKAWEDRARWEAGAVETNPESHIPSARESMATAFFGERLSKRYRQLTGGEKKESWVYERKDSIG